MSDPSEVSPNTFALEVLKRAELRREKLRLGQTPQRTVAPVAAVPAADVEGDQNRDPDPPAPAPEHALATDLELKSSLETGVLMTNDDDIDMLEVDEDLAMSPSEMQEEQVSPVAGLPVDIGLSSVGRRGPLKRLGQLYSDLEVPGENPGMYASPVHGHSIGEKTPEAPQVLKSMTGGDKGKGFKTRFSALAQEINNWDDNMRHTTPPASRFNITSAGPGSGRAGVLTPKSPKRTLIGPLDISTTTPTTHIQGSPVKRPATVIAVSPKKLNMEQNPSIPAPPPPPVPSGSASPPKYLFGTQTQPQQQQYPRSPSPAKKIQKLDPVVEDAAPAPIKAPAAASKVSFPTGISVSQRTKQFETSICEASMVKQKDPSEMTVAQRAKYFERQAKESAAAAAARSGPLRPGPQPVKFKPMTAAPVPTKSTEETAPAPKSIASLGGHVAQMRQILQSGHKPQDTPTPSPEKQVKFEEPKSPPNPKVIVTAVSPEHPSLLKVKPIRVSPPKPGSMYPSLTDIECNTETETEPETEADDVGSVNTTGTTDYDYKEGNGQEQDSELSLASSLGAKIVRVAQTQGRGDESLISDTLACEKVNEFIDAALEGMMDSITDDAGPIDSSSPIHPCLKTPVAASAPRYRPSLRVQTEGTTAEPLLQHSVSVYRLQRDQHNTPRRNEKLKYEDSFIEEDNDDSDDTARSETTGTDSTKTTKEKETEQKIEDLQKDLEAQLRLISQASKGITLAKSTVEFAESSETVDLERVLLIASLKRLAITNEISRLRTEGILAPLRDISPMKRQLGPSCTGKIEITDIGLALKRDFLQNALNGDTIHHFIGLIKCRSYLEASPVVSIGHGLNSVHVKDGILHFPKSWSLGGLDPDFKLVFEIYSLKTQREFLPHDTKYHIGKKENKTLTLTPKGKKNESKFSRPVMPSPAGPDVVRSPNFSLIGSLSIGISSLRRTHWRLEQRNTLTSPLEGSASVDITCFAENGVDQEGFLAIFKDVSGLGSWERRYCRLTPSSLDWWMYPEDKEDGKTAISSIPLRFCVTPEVRAASHEICARSNSFLFVTARPPMDGDEDSLNISCKPEYTAIRHLMAADSGRERENWCKALNTTLANLRAWDPKAKSPDDTAF